MTNALMAFTNKASNTLNSSKPRLVFAMDATASREDTWTEAQRLQREMFAAAAQKLQVQLVYFRGNNECSASDWVLTADAIESLMSSIQCEMGNTQIERVLTHVVDETQRKRVDAFVYVGDSFEEREAPIMALCEALKASGIKGFFFHEGSRDEQPFREMARANDGVFAKFDGSAASTLGDLLNSVAAFTSGGIAALEKQDTAASRLMIAQLKKD